MDDEKWKQKKCGTKVKFITAGEYRKEEALEARNSDVGGNQIKKTKLKKADWQSWAIMSSGTVDVTEGGLWGLHGGRSQAFIDEAYGKGHVWQVQYPVTDLHNLLYSFLCRCLFAFKIPSPFIYIPVTLHYQISYCNNSLIPSFQLCPFLLF